MIEKHSHVKLNCENSVNIRKGYGGTSMTIEEMKSKFAEVFGDCEGVREYFSPGRVNLIGEHTDYNGGHVFPCALTIGTYGLARPRKDGKIRLFSANLHSFGVVEAPIHHLENLKKYGWANYPLGVVWAFAKRNIVLEHGFDMLVYGTIPNGSGLSSSASLEVLTGVILCDLFDIKQFSMVDLAVIGQYSENNFNGLNCGIMDQFAVAMGKKDAAIFLDTRDLSYEYANILLPDAKIVIVNSKVKHSLVDSKYNERRNECAMALGELQEVVGIDALGDLNENMFDQYQSAIKDDVRRKRAKHAVYENQRTIRAVAALRNNDIEEFGKLMNASHVSLRDDYKVSCEEIDILVELAWGIDGVVGSRITGGGFGGCTVSVVKNEAVDTFKKVIVEGYRKETSKVADIYVVDIGDGARRLH